MEANQVIAMMCKEDRLFFDTLEPEEQRLIVDAIRANVKGGDDLGARKLTQSTSEGSLSRPALN